MKARLVVFSLAPLFATSLAHAQAPGEMEPQAPQPAAAPCDAGCGGCAVAAAAPQSVMARRWAIGLSVGSMGIAPESQPDSTTDFAIGELSLRFRATPHLELELAVAGGREQTADHQDGDRDVSQAMLALRYRFRPEHAWNWFVTGGIGGGAVTRHDATKQERDDAMQPAAMLGIGLERRFHSFALQAEARAVGFGERKHNNDGVALPMPVEPQVSSPMPVPVAATPSEKRSGGSLTIGVSYYF